MTDGNWEDGSLPEDAAIDAAHPMRSGRHDIYAEAMRLVGARHSKGGLVELVNWLLVRCALVEAEAYERGFEAGVSRCADAISPFGGFDQETIVKVRNRLYELKPEGTAAEEKGGISSG